MDSENISHQDLSDMHVFFTPYKITNIDNMINAIYVNINDIDSDFTELYKQKIQKVIMILQEYCTVMQQNNKQCFSEIKFKINIENFFENKDNWDLVDTSTDDDILKLILTTKQLIGMLQMEVLKNQNLKNLKNLKNLNLKNLKNLKNLNLKNLNLKNLNLKDSKFMMV